MKKFVGDLSRKIFVNDNQAIFSIVVFSSSIFFIASTAYAVHVFVQFTVLEVIAVSLAFLIVFVLLLAIFLPFMRKEKIFFSWTALFWSFLIAAFLLVILNSPSAQLFAYYRTFPLLEAEVGLGWHKDSAYHASIIQSFVSFGFPSIGQHETPFTNYHVLSHFVDSLIVRMTGVEVWDSYGMFYFFKAVLLLMSVLFFIGSVTLRQRNYVLVISLIFITPIVASSWHAIGSHGLWFTSLLVILSAPWVFNVLTQRTRLKHQHFLLLFLLFVTVSLGKISSGFMYAAFAGLILLISRPRDLRVYLFGMSLVTFFVIYYSTFSYSRGELNLSEIFNFVPYLSPRDGSLVWQIYLLILISGIIALVFSSRPAFFVFIGSVLSVLVLAMALNAQPLLTGSDRFYFRYGLLSVLILFVFQAVIWSFVNKKGRSFEGAINFNHIALRSVLAIVLVFATSEFNSTRYSFFNAGLSSTYEVIKNAYSQPFAYLNSYDKNLRANMVLQFADRNYVDLDKYDRPMTQFRDSLSGFMEAKNIDSTNSLIFMPKEILQSDISSFGGSWDRGMFVYSVTGVPMIHGIAALRDTYGHRDYGDDALQISREEFDPLKACEFGKNIIVVEEFSTSSFSLERC